MIIGQAIESPGMGRRDFLRTSAGALAGLSLGGLSAFGDSTPGRKKPNVLFIAVDDLRPQLNCYGHKQMVTPHIDKLAASGTRFDRAYCQVPICGASRSSLLTGLRPTDDRFLVWNSSIKEAGGARTLPRHFLTSGYLTYGYGKIYHHRGEGRDGWTEAWRHGGEFPGYATKRSKQIWREHKKASKKRGVKGPPVEAGDLPDSAYPDGKLTDRVIKQMRDLATQEKPFFLSAGFVRPHLAFACPKRYWDMYKPDEIDLDKRPDPPKNLPDAALTNWWELRRYADIPEQGPVDDDMARTLIHGYYACVSFIDAQVGRLMGELKKLGLADNTVVILWGDHGFHLGEYDLWCKYTNFEDTVRCPMIIRAPGVKPSATRGLCEFVDIYPTLSELCGLGVPDHCQGDSLVPLMADPDRAWKRAVYSRVRFGESIKTDRYRYSEWRRDGESMGRMLYDHQRDPQETINIVDQPEHAALVRTLREQLQAGWKPVRAVLRRG